MGQVLPRERNRRALGRITGLLLQEGVYEVFVGLVHALFLLHCGTSGRGPSVGGMPVGRGRSPGSSRTPPAARHTAPRRCALHSASGFICCSLANRGASHGPGPACGTQTSAPGRAADPLQHPCRLRLAEGGGRTVAHHAGAQRLLALPGLLGLIPCTRPCASSGVDGLRVEAVEVEVVDAGAAMSHKASVFLITAGTLTGGSRCNRAGPVAEAALRLQYGGERGVLPDPENDDSTGWTPQGSPQPSSRTPPPPMVGRGGRPPRRGVTVQASSTPRTRRLPRRRTSRRAPPPTCGCSPCRHALRTSVPSGKARGRRFSRS